MSVSEGLRIGIVIDTYETSGPGRQLLALTIALKGMGLVPQLFCFQRGDRRHPFVDTFGTANVPVVVLQDHGPLDMTLPFRLRRALRAAGSDIVQSHGYRATVVVALAQALGLRRPWIAFHHGATAENRRMAIYLLSERIASRFADAMVVMSAEQQLQFRGHARVHKIFNAVLPPASDSALSPELTSALASIRRPVLGVFARLSKEKGVDVFLQALARLAQTMGEPPSAIIVGDGPCRAGLEKQAAELGLAAMVVFLGHIASVHALYPLVDAVVLPSRSEGLPNVLLEALYHNRPIVATAVGAMPEIVGQGPGAILVPPDNPGALADGMLRALCVPDTEDARSARRRIAQRLTPQARAEAHRELYHSVLVASDR